LLKTKKTGLFSSPSCIPDLATDCTESTLQAVTGVGVYRPAVRDKLIRYTARKEGKEGRKEGRKDTKEGYTKE
jgi:hypothetical protein